MNTHRLAPLLLLLALSGPAAPADPAGETLLLADQGAPKAVIVIPGGREWKTESWIIQVEQHAAACLQANLAQITGATLPILAEPALGNVALVDGRLVPESGKTTASNFILVGEGELAKKLGVTHEGLQPGGLRLRTTANALVLIGHPAISHPTEDGGGLRRAVTTFLESLGCRYLWPGELGKVMPAIPTLAVGPLDLAFSPPIQQRRIRPVGLTPEIWNRMAGLGFSYADGTRALQEAGQTRAEQLGRKTGTMRSIDFTWLQWQGLGGNIGIGGGHAFGDAWEKWGASHPDWFAMQGDGTREQSKAGGREQLCTSSTGLVQAIADGILAEAAETPDKKCYSICPNDGGYSSFCLCEACRKLDPTNAPMVSLQIFDHAGKSARREVTGPSLTDRYLVFWNAIAERVTRARPDLVLLIQAYSSYSHAPVREKLHPSLVLRYVPSDTAEWAGWQKAGATKVYWRPNLFHTGSKTGELRNTPRQLADAFHYLAANGMLATDIDALIGHWATCGLSYYAAARLNWNPALTADDILDDYARAGFGPAAEPVKRYFQLAEERFAAKGQTSPPPPEAFADLRDCLTKADQAAGSNDLVRARIDFLRLGLNHTELSQTLARFATDARAGRPVDKARIRPLLNLYTLSLRDFAQRQPLAINAPWILYRGGNLASWEPIGGRNYAPPSDLVQKVEEAGLHLTGRENSIAEMMAAFSLTDSDAPLSTPAGQKAPKEEKRVIDADENGRALEL
jgi:hypothetical protein